MATESKEDFGPSTGGGGAAGATENPTSIRFVKGNKSNVRVYYPGRVVRVVYDDGSKELIHENSNKGRNILSGKYGEKFRKYFNRELQKRITEPNIVPPTAGPVTSAPTESAMKHSTENPQPITPTPPTNIAYRPNIADIMREKRRNKYESYGRYLLTPQNATKMILPFTGSSLNKSSSINVLIICDSWTCADKYRTYHPAGVSADCVKGINDWYETTRETELTEMGAAKAAELSNKYNITYSSFAIYAKDIPSCKQTASILFQNLPYELIDRNSTLTNTDISNNRVIIVDRQTYIYLTKDTEPSPLDAHLFSGNLPTKLSSFLAEGPTDFVEGVSPTEFTPTDTCVLSSPLPPVASLLPPHFIEAIKLTDASSTPTPTLYVDAVTTLLVEYIAYLGEPGLPLDAILWSAMNKTIVNTLRQIVTAKELLTALSSEQKNTAYSLFIKLVDCVSEVYKVEKAWPLSGYDKRLPDIVKVSGYRMEPQSLSGYRQFHIFFEGRKNKIQTREQFIADIYRVANQQTNDLQKIEQVQALSTVRDAEYQTKTRQYRLDGYTLLENRNPFDRFIEFISKTGTYSSFIKTLNLGNYSSEFRSEPILGSYKSSILTDKKDTFDQQIFLILPNNINPSEINDNNESFSAENPDLNLEKDSAWIIPNWPIRGKTDLKGGLRFQGWYLKTQPAIEVLRVLWGGVRDMSDHARTLLPELKTIDGCHKFVMDCIQFYKKHIEAMPEGLEKDYHKDVLTTMNEVIFVSEQYKKVMKQVSPSITADSGLINILRNVNMTANRDPNAAFNVYNRNILPKYSVEIGLRSPSYKKLTKRRKGFFSSESKNSYRRTIKKDFYNLMRASGAKFTPADAIAELPYIRDLANNPVISDSAVAGRMVDWANRYVNDKTPGENRVELRKKNPEMVELLDRIANLFITLNKASPPPRQSLKTLANEALRMANPEAYPSRAEDMEAAVRQIVYSPKIIRGKALYDALKEIIMTYSDVVKENPSIKRAVDSIAPPPKRGFFSFGRNTAYEGQIQAAAQKLLLSLTQEPKYKNGLLIITSSDGKPKRGVAILLNKNLEISKINKHLLIDKEYLKTVVKEIRITEEEYKNISKEIPTDDRVVEYWVNANKKDRIATVERSEDGLIGDYGLYDGTNSKQKNEYLKSKRIRIIPTENIDSLLIGTNNDSLYKLQQKYPVYPLNIYTAKPQIGYVIQSTKEGPASAGSILPAGKNANVKLESKIYKITETIVEGGGAAGTRDITKYYYVLEENGVIKSSRLIDPTNNRNLNLKSAKDITGNEVLRNEVISKLVTMPNQGGGSRKTTRHNKRMARRNRTRKQKQHGGAATTMPLAWYQPGAQFQGTVADPTGGGLAGSSATWVRSALPAQEGGSMLTTRQGGGRRRKTRKQQKGGFSPSVMGAGFASVGMRLLPAAAYMGYNQYNNFRKRTHRRQRK